MAVSVCLSSSRKVRQKMAVLTPIRLMRIYFSVTEP
jgi:hypothetical protein